MASSEAISSHRPPPFAINGVIRGNQWRHQRPSVASSEAVSAHQAPPFAARARRRWHAPPQLNREAPLATPRLWGEEGGGAW